MILPPIPPVAPEGSINYFIEFEGIMYFKHYPYEVSEKGKKNSAQAVGGMQVIDWFKDAYWRGIICAVASFEWNRRPDLKNAQQNALNWAALAPFCPEDNFTNKKV